MILQRLLPVLTHSLCLEGPSLLGKLLFTLQTCLICPFNKEAPTAPPPTAAEGACSPSSAPAPSGHFVLL